MPALPPRAGRHTGESELFEAVEGKCVAVPYLYIQAGSTVSRAGEVGTLVLPFWLADELRLASAPDREPALTTEVVLTTE